MTVSPLLRFISRSADGCWTVLARPDDRAGPEPRLRGSGQDRRSHMGSDLRLPGSRAGEAAPGLMTRAKIARSSMRSPGSIVRCSRISIRSAMSRCAGIIGWGWSSRRARERGSRSCDHDYPFGRPARFAYVDEARRFRVVEASSGEKGPFHILAEGRLEPMSPWRSPSGTRTDPSRDLTLLTGRRRPARSSRPRPAGAFPKTPSSSA